ncbi:glycosyltransferase [Thermodesulforhabdus norvegica]|uniref:Glycosyltransferase involved in cell wall bisynthesis n=1 Tax=Thermodesulforhabdus norvegica TaxID=39841 RepID=A0A1I4SSF6_9BACT|nr:glycosyltransferase [Thermodesulforhabdus norvegica]SFM67478.1 Glycosyltransferase involved in cell wall bisynthesis [Thermodesulforhabdus norvegica]
MKELKILHIGKYYPPAEGGIEHFLYDLVMWQVKHFPARVGVLVHDHKKGSRDTLTRSGNDHFVYRAGVVGSLAYAPVSPSFPVALARILKSYRPEVLHVHMPNLSALWVLALRPQVPLVLHWHSDVVPTPYDRTLRKFYTFYRIFEKRLLKKAALIIATSPPYLETSPALRKFRNRCRVIPLGINPARLDATHGKTGREQFFVLSVGRFTYYKGFQYLIEAMQYVNGAFLTIVGDGVLRKEHKKYVEKLGLVDRVSLPGRISNRELANMLYSCDVFCLPSIERTEAFGLVLLEAMSFSKPLITTIIEGSGVTWVNQNNVTGVHVPPRDAIALAGAIQFFRENPDLAKSYGENGKRRFNSMFHISRVACEIWKLYEEVC